MASYRYERDIAPKDLTPRKKRTYTRKERWANWWDYNLKWVLLIGIAAAFVAYSFIGQYFFTTKPDYNVAVVAPYYLPDDTVTALQEQLARYGEDLNGDGVVAPDVTRTDAEATAVELDPECLHAGLFCRGYPDRERCLPDHGGHHQAGHRCGGRPELGVPAV